ncbi:TPA: endopeptidase La [Candidatus Dependentiae bacterium]|nr:MAG: Lon protease [candidate division TM6 bacterium GW2011_GWF2_36_131]KKQ03782.1 MAG: Lon protease [candidate division TM6 bacterium GW2011_GWE2_36_25]KKQ19928.1 MAG: Lon protease [candidate division TM6 bacterium GW2011_GWA2_36_9]HBR70548.1 endopeptidase La [Candidatus Dependentiae bacterium]HCU00736.1 endopeptidase La [Candidatus Dependentiae bacterium]
MEIGNKGLEKIPKSLPVIPTIDVVVFPHMIVPLLVIDDRIIKGIESAAENNKLIFLVASKNQTENQSGAISTTDLYDIGTIATIMRIVQLPEGGLKILVQGVAKARATEISAEDQILIAHLEALDINKENDEQQIEANIRNIKTLAEKMTESGQTLSPDFNILLSKMTDPDKIADFVVSHLNLTVEQSQRLLEIKSHQDLLSDVYILLRKEADVSEVQEKIRNNTRESMNKSQKEYYLREQLRAIKKELGEDDAEEVEEMKEKLNSIPFQEEARAEVKRQISRLEKTAPDSMEATVLRNYLDWMFALPWGNETPDNLDINHAREVLEEDHFGLKEIKDRILDFISVRKLKQDGFTPILCFVGPPGTGKTSLGQSIARALGRRYHRISLGGVKDESEIRGHRRTYVGAMPGRLIQAIRKAGSLNPVIIIDELDKIGADFRGDPSAAMLEVLDPQQNKGFYDNYLGVSFDLSHVIFIATANSLETISQPLRDRMEIISVEGYTQEEKIEIAKKYLIQRAKYSTGLEGKDIKLSEEAIAELIGHHTRESGVRQLERLIHKLCSKAAREIVEGHDLPEFKLDNIIKFLGPPKFIDEDINNHDEIGICNGLAWTAYGGEMIKIEAVLMSGKGKLILTGQLGDVMKESAQAALSYARAHADEFEIDSNLFQTHDLHIHVPAGGIPKDGPSAGITMLSAILSVFTYRPINAKFAMTGELDLQGRVMAIGGVKEKILAAKRNGISHVILPEKNKNDLHLLSEILHDIDVIFVDHANEVLKRVLMKPCRKKVHA